MSAFNAHKPYVGASIRHNASAITNQAIVEVVGIKNPHLYEIIGLTAEVVSGLRVNGATDIDATSPLDELAIKDALLTTTRQLQHEWFGSVPSLARAASHAIVMLRIRQKNLPTTTVQELDQIEEPSLSIAV